MVRGDLLEGSAFEVVDVCPRIEETDAGRNFRVGPEGLDVEQQAARLGIERQPRPAEERVLGQDPLPLAGQESVGPDHVALCPVDAAIRPVEETGVEDSAVARPHRIAGNRSLDLDTIEQAVRA